MINLDESCIMANDRKLRVLGCAERKKHERNMDDSRVSITILRMGCAAGVSGPWIFLAAGAKMDCNALTKEKLKRKGAPTGS